MRPAYTENSHTMYNLNAEKDYKYLHGKVIYVGEFWRVMWGSCTTAKCHSVNVNMKHPSDHGTQV